MQGRGTGVGVEEADLKNFMARLLNADNGIRQAARREMQAWPFETVAAILGFAYRQTETACSSSGRPRWLAFWKPSSDAAAFPQPYDMLTVLLAEHQEDVRFAWAAMSVLARYYAFRDRAERTDSEEGRPRWGSGLMMQRTPLLRLDLYNELSGNNPLAGWYARYEKPLLASLCRLLPRIDPASCSVPPSFRNTLLRALRYPYRDVELTLALLDFLGATGGAECYGTLERLQNGGIDTNNGHKIRIAAQSCRTRIAIRNDKKRQAQTLLRAAASPAPSDAHTLLRSFRESAPESAPEQLLRPAE